MIINDNVQKELVEKILQACDNGDIKEVKSLFGMIDLNSTYHVLNSSPVIIYNHACLTFNLDVIEALIEIPQQHDYDNSVMHNAFESLINSNNINSHKILTYLLTEPKLKKNRIKTKGFNSVLHASLKSAAQNDDVEVFKLLLNLEHPKQNNLWFFESIRVFHYACSHNNDGNIMRYIHNEPQLDDYAEPILGFRAACYYKNLKVLQYFIFEYGIEKTEGIEVSIKEYKCEEANRMFELRDLNSQLNTNLTFNQDTSKKNKV